ncbi:class I SAM-dependent methyltransferase [Gordonia malaquae]|uniref:class I SAM-dependent methyltransferase n=1 Tax=Gordonia malaquae TaxID=410332 RepID=UPI003017DF56
MSHDHDHHAAPTQAPRHPESAQEWDERYRMSDRIWTTNVNPALLVEADSLQPGSALDVGSGEGADARWLTGKGWAVTAVDISQVAIDRAREADPKGTISWNRVDLAVEPVPNAPFDLVSAFYFPIPQGRRVLVDALIGAVAPGGTLLVVAHEAEGMRAHGFDPADFFQPADIAGLLGDGWVVEVSEVRPRGIAAGNGAHINDEVLKARRLA